MSKITEKPRGGCALSGISAVLSAMEKVCPVFHAGPGCAFQSIASEEGHGGGKQALYFSGAACPSSNMLEKDVVFGGVDKLRTTIQGAIYIIDADAYFVLSGCTAGINGDDIEGVVKEFDKSPYPVYSITTPGFAGNTLVGYETVINTFINKVFKKTKTQKNLVNILGIIPFHDPYWSGSLEELTRIFNALGLEVNTFFTDRQGIKNVEKAGNAALNIIISPILLKGAEKTLLEKFGIPSVRFNAIPIGPTETSKFVRKVADALKLDSKKVEAFVQNEEDYVYRYYEAGGGRLAWKRFAVVGDASYVIALTKFLADEYSFSPVLAIISEPLLRPTDKDIIEKELSHFDYARPPQVYFESDLYEITKIISENEDITLLIGSSDEREIALKQGITFRSITFPITDRLIFNKTYTGYKGALTLVEDLFDNL
ncbi:MAG: nitrogenase molybdenum-iron protein, alpha and beta chain [Treponema sp.]|nr:nitrogenase molybdenum-iron protein, alpha and beta chain [Treponema sp.]